MYIEGSSELWQLVGMKIVPFFQNGLTGLSQVYTGDVIQVVGDNNVWDTPWYLDCLTYPLRPCSVTIEGDNTGGKSRINVPNGGGIACNDGCTGATLRRVALACDPNVPASMDPLQIAGAGAILHIEDSVISGSAAIADGGSIRALDGATVKVSGSTIRGSSSQVFHAKYASRLSVLHCII